MPEYSKIPKLCELNEDFTAMDKAKFRPKSYHRKNPEHIMRSLPCWYRVYVDGYGGGESLGGESYEGEVGVIHLFAHLLVKSIIKSMQLMRNSL